MEKLTALRVANELTSSVLSNLKSFILREKVVTTEEVNLRAERLVKLLNFGRNKVEPAFKNYKGFPASVCISINDTVVHGLPSKEKLIKRGDLVSLDFGIKYNGYCADMAISFVNSRFSFGKKQKLVEATKEALDLAIANLEKQYPNCYLSNITSAIEEKGKNYGIVYKYGGHGIGKEVHQGNLFVPNSWKAFKKDQTLPIETVFTIEPMFTLGTGEIVIGEDGYSIKTKDGSLAAHFEYSIMITNKGVEVLK